MKRSYIFCILLALGIFVTGFTEISLSQQRNKSTSSKAKRAGSLNKSSQSNKGGKQTNKGGKQKRAAVSNSSTSVKSSTSAGKTKRAATNSSSSGVAARRAGSTSTARAMSRTMSRQTATKSTQKTSNNCPINTLIRRIIDDEGNEIYYSEKNTTCTLDENVDVMQWNEASKDSYPLNMYQVASWIGKDNAYYLVCKSGYVEDEVDGKATCVPYLDICPLNEIIVKEGDNYIHPGKTADAENTCRPLKKSKLRLLSKEEYNANSDYSYNYAYDDINIFECPENSYSVSSNYPGIADTCKACPYMINGERVFASKGSTSEEDCRPICKENGVPVKKISIREGNTFVCKACDENGATFKDNICVTNPGYICYEKGIRCDKILSTSDCVDEATLSKDKIKCLCNDGLVGDGLKTGSGCYSTSVTAADCVSGATFDNTGHCKCPDGYFGDGLKDNAASPYCKYFSKIAGDTMCKNTYENGKGTAIPRGCIPNCTTGTYWGE